MSVEHTLEEGFVWNAGDVFRKAEETRTCEEVTTSERKMRLQNPDKVQGFREAGGKDDGVS